MVGHSGQVRGIEFSGDGKSVISIADQKTPFQWSLDKLSSIPMGRADSSVADPKNEPVIGSTDMVEALAANQSHDLIAAADLSGQLTLSSFADITKPLKSFALGDEMPESVIWHPISSDLIVVSTGELSSIVWIPKDANQVDQTFRFEVPKMLRSAAMDPRASIC
jgi:WD40 repeat protein